MFKTIFKAGFKISILVCFAICVALFASKLTRPSTYLEIDNTKAKVDGFYALEENSLDVLGIGTSHLYSGLNPSVLAHYTGLSSYDFAGSNWQFHLPRRREFRCCKRRCHTVQKSTCKPISTGPDIPESDFVIAISLFIS